jgi:hypothetical protein
MTVELYQQHMINRNGWATATEIQAAANLFGLNINILKFSVIGQEKGDILIQVTA